MVVDHVAVLDTAFLELYSQLTRCSSQACRALIGLVVVSITVITTVAIQSSQYQMPTEMLSNS